MEQSTLEINVISASDLKDVNLVTKMDVYAVVSISGDSKHPKKKAKTNVHRGSGTNPTWNFPLSFTIDESLAQNNRLTLVFKLVSQRSLGDKDVGEVNVPIKELFASRDEGNNNSMKFVSYQVRKPSGKPKGELRFSYRFGKNAAGKPAADKPVTAYPAAAEVGPSYPPPTVTGHVGVYPPAAAASAPPAYGGAGYPPPQAGYVYQPPPPGYGYTQAPGYGYTQTPSYGYPPAQGYGYPPPQQGPKKSNKFGMGLGAGLLGGAIGGLLIGDMVSDAAAFDGGFGDAGGFDF
ncbi:hypothetical protein L484_023544 [Morus notabilis]|uniref:C2 domain-containing protein n=1 Tax=Morus notabilis TaxID=981085 RepID=W9RVI2_9ROSA|nr:protein SRC2 [Morus notabilis]EXB74800.1 hypothetical protein L484_023544 [Morus notabilis]